MTRLVILALCGLAACDAADAPVAEDRRGDAVAAAAQQAVGDTDAALRDAASPATTGTN